MAHVLGAAVRSDDAFAGEQLIAERVIAVAVSVHQRADVTRSRYGVMHRREHLTGMAQIEEGID